jgi:hypothetical protein
VIEFPRFVFVAELAEILMEFTGNGWDPGQSTGEGLSNLLAALLHPNGYYATGQGPRINQWLNGGGGPPPFVPRQDFISNTINTDQDQFSYGCAILFINYLVYQRGYTLKEVIGASGSTLAETYSHLTGEPVSAAFNAFNALLQAHIGNTTTNNMQRDNIFPLVDLPFRSLQVTVGDPIDKGHFSDPQPVQWQVKPGIVCPEDFYGYYSDRMLVETPVYARARGMANAVFRWTVEGVDLPVHGSWANATVNSPLTVKNPDMSETIVANSVTFSYNIVDIWNGSVLYMKSQDWNGNCLLNFSVAAKEAAIIEAETSVSDKIGLDTVSWRASEETKKAFKRCNPFYADVNDSIWYLTERLVDLVNRPDPPNVLNVRGVIRAVEQVQRAVEKFAGAGPLSSAEVLRQFSSTNGLQSVDPVPAEANLTQLPPTVTSSQVSPDAGST